MRLLVITYTFPPSVISNAKRPHYVVRNLLEAGWKVDVYTSRFGMAPREAETVDHSNLRIFRADDVNAEIRNRSRSSKWARWTATAVNGVLWPDSAVYWARKAATYAAKHRTEYDRVLGYVIPASVLLTGTVFGLVDQNWIFDFQESVSPYHQLYPRRSPLQRAWFKRTLALERTTLSQAGRVIFTAETNRQAYIAHKLVVPDKTVHIPYFYDSSEFTNLPAISSDTFEIAYFGSFDWRGERSPETFLRAFAGFLRGHPEARSRSRFRFYGPWLDEHNALLQQLGLWDVVSICPAVSYSAYIEKLKASPVLLLVVATAHNLFMPSKIVDYFGARRPILAFLNRQSEMRQVLESAGMAQYACDELDVEAGTGALERLWEQFQSGQLAASSEKTAPWSSSRQLARYCEVLGSPQPSTSHC